MSEKNGQSNYFEVGTMRHAPKADIQEEQGYQVDDQEVNQETAKEQAASVAQSVLSRLADAPAGTIMALEPSIITRAQQTRELLVAEIQNQLESHSDIEIVTIGTEQTSADQVLNHIDQNPSHKFIISDLRATELIGFNQDDRFVEAIQRGKETFKGNEDFIGKLWAAHQEELPQLQEELRGAGYSVDQTELQPSAFKVTPEAIALKHIRWMTAMKRIGKKYFPNRPIILEGISHNLRADFAALALLGEDINLRSINQVLGGEFRQPFERSSLTFLSTGEVTAELKGVSKSYSAEEFQSLLDRLRQQSTARQIEWEASEKS